MPLINSLIKSNRSLQMRPRKAGTAIAIIYKRYVEVKRWGVYKWRNNEDNLEKLN